MGLLSTKEKVFANLVLKHASLTGDMEILRLNIGGAIQSTEWFIKGAGGAHPLRDILVDSDNKFLKDLLSFGYVNLITDKDSGLVVLSPGSFDIDGQNTIVVEVGSGNGGVVIPREGASIKKWRDAYTNGSIYDIDISFAVTSDDKGIWCDIVGDTTMVTNTREFGSVVGKKGNYANNIYPEITGLMPRSYPTGPYLSLDAASPDSIPNLDPNRVYWPKGITLSHVRPGWSTRKQLIPIPFVSGFRRATTVVSNNLEGVGILTAFSYYIIGEGEDEFSCAFDYQSDGSYGSASQFSRCSPSGKLLTRKFSSIDIERYYPLTMNSNVLKLIELERGGKIEKEVVLGDSNTITYASGDFTSSGYFIEFDKAYYDDYLKTGGGFSKPLADDRRREIMASWAKIPQVICLLTCDWTGTVSLKDTAVYAEYGRARAKACKTNDYLDLQYNNEYSMKMVENKLSAVTNVKRIALDMSIIGMSATPPAKLTNTFPVCTLTYVDDVNATSRFTYVVSEGSSGTFFASEVGLSSFFESVMPCIFSGDVAKLESILNSEGSVEKLPTANSVSSSTSDLRMTSVSIPNTSGLRRMINTMDSNQRAVLMSAQVTDYSHIVNKGVTLAQSMTGNNVQRLLNKVLGAL